MARAKRCPICLASPDVTSRVNAMLESGVKLAAIATEVGQFSTFQLSISAGAILGHITPRERGAAAEEN